MDNSERDRLLIRANILCAQGKFEAAEKLLNQVRRSFVGDTEAWYMLERIKATKDVEKAHEYRFRVLRHSLGMQTSFNRFCYWMGSIIAGIVAVHNLVDSIKNGRAFGFAYEITTTYYSKSGRHDYVRPVYEDLIWASCLLIVAITVAIVVQYASRGASDWEELDIAGSSSIRR